MPIPDVSITRYGDEISGGGAALDVNNTAITYVPAASGNTANLNSVVTDPNGDVWVIDSVGDAKKISSVTCQAYFDTQTFIATAGQTTFTLSQTPTGDVIFSRNGMVINDAAASVTGTTVTYVPANNSNQAMVAGDRVEIAYVYNVCTGGAAPTVVDGSETKVISGTGVTVSGSGTAGNPYVVRTAAGVVGSFAQLTNATGAAAPGPYALNAKVNLTTLDASYGTMVVPNAAAAQMTLKAGGVYKIEAGLFIIWSGQPSAAKYGIYANGTLIGVSATASPLTHSTAVIQTNEQAVAFLAPTVDTVIELRLNGYAGTITSIGNYVLQAPTGRDCYFSAHCIGMQ